MAAPFIALGVVTGAHGVRGAVKIKPFTVTLDGLLAHKVLYSREGEAYTLKPAGEIKGQLITSFPHINDRNQAEALRGLELGVMRDALPEVDSEDEYYVSDLIGMQVVLEDGAVYGTLHAFYNFGAGDIAEILLPDGKKEMLPFTNEVFPIVDMVNKIIIHNVMEIIENSPLKT